MIEREEGGGGISLSKYEHTRINRIILCGSRIGRKIIIERICARSKYKTNNNFFFFPPGKVP